MKKLYFPWLVFVHLFFKVWLRMTYVLSEKQWEVGQVGNRKSRKRKDNILLVRCQLKCLYGSLHRLFISLSHSNWWLSNIDSGSQQSLSRASLPWFGYLLLTAIMIPKSNILVFMAKEDLLIYLSSIPRKDYGGNSGYHYKSYTSFLAHPKRWA